MDRCEPNHAAIAAAAASDAVFNIRRRRRRRILPTFFRPRIFRAHFLTGVFSLALLHSRAAAAASDSELSYFYAKKIPGVMRKCVTYVAAAAAAAVEALWLTPI